MPNDVLPVDTGVAAFVTLVRLAAHVVEHVLLGEGQDSGLELSLPSYVHLAHARSLRGAVGVGSQVVLACHLTKKKKETEAQGEGALQWRRAWSCSQAAWCHSPYLAHHAITPSAESVTTPDAGTLL
jgi:hypothetical protein